VPRSPIARDIRRFGGIPRRLSGQPGGPLQRRKEPTGAQRATRATKPALSLAAICACVFLLSSPVPAFAQATALAHFDITQVSFTATGAIKVQMAYSCPANSVFDRDQGTILVVEQERTGAGTGLGPFSHKLVCDGRTNSVVIRVVGATQMGFDTSAPIEVIVNASLHDADGVLLGAVDANTVRPHAAPDPARTLADADVMGMTFTSRGSVRVRFSYKCPLRYEPVVRSTRLFLNQIDSMNTQITGYKRISALIVCDGTRHDAVAKVRGESRQGERFDPTAPLNVFVDATVSRPNGTTALFANEKAMLSGSGAAER
jgi:hypothetical protein